jgi:hypothetical protein
MATALCFAEGFSLYKLAAITEFMREIGCQEREK